MADNNYNQRGYVPRSGVERRRNPRRRAEQPPVEQAIFEAILRGLWALVSWPFRRGQANTRNQRIPEALAHQLASHWAGIEEHRGDPERRALAVSEADKLFDAAMQAAGVIGLNMGERLKNAATMFPRDLYESLWQAHKLRNTLAHEIGIVLSEHETNRAVSAFQAGLRYLGLPL